MRRPQTVGDDRGEDRPERKAEEKEALERPEHASEDGIGRGPLQDRPARDVAGGEPDPTATR